MISLALFPPPSPLIANHFNFPVNRLAVRQSLIATQLELRLQRHHTDIAKHAWFVEGFSELAALWVSFLSLVILRLLIFLTFQQRLKQQPIVIRKRLLQQFESLKLAARY